MILRDATLKLVGGQIRYVMLSCFPVMPFAGLRDLALEAEKCNYGTVFSKLGHDCRSRARFECFLGHCH